MPLRQATAFKITSLIFGAMLFISLGLLLIFQLQVESRWTAMNRRCEELREEFRREDGQRPVLRGNPSPGDARADYEAALRASEAFALFFSDSSVEARLVLWEGKEGPVSDAELQRSLESVIAPLKRGAGRGQFLRKLGLDLRPGPEQMDYPTAVVRIAAVRARDLARKGRRREAAELVLDSCRFGADLGDQFLLRPGLTALSDLLADEALDRKDSLEIARELAIVESIVPRRSRGAQRMLLAMGTDFVESGGSADIGLIVWGVPETPVGWECGWSLRLLLANGFLGADHLCRDLERRDGLGWVEACAKWTAPRELTGPGDNPIPPRFEYIEVPFDLHFRATLAQVRILRVAAQFRASGEILSLQDPFGTSIQTRKTGARLRVWSEGVRGAHQIYRFQASEPHSLNFHPRPDAAVGEIDLEVPP